MSTDAGGDDLEVRALTVRAGSVRILDDVAFRVEAGEHVAIVGPSGAGKSTLLRVIAGLLEPDRGEVRSAGVDWSRDARVLVPPERRGIGMIAQDLALWPHLTAREHLSTALRWRGFPRDGRSSEAARLLSWVGLSDRADHRPAQLSGGESQRLALVRALAGGTRLLLLDEPFTGLDLPLRRALGAEFAAVARQRGATVLHVTHDPVDAERHARRILVLEHGAVAQIGEPAVLRAQPASAFVAALFSQ